MDSKLDPATPAAISACFLLSDSLAKLRYINIRPLLFKGAPAELGVFLEDSDLLVPKCCIKKSIENYERRIKQPVFHGKGVQGRIRGKFCVIFHIPHEFVLVENQITTGITDWKNISKLPTYIYHAWKNA